MIHFGDVTKIDGTKVPKVDVITFGAPCQDLSVAGKRAGMKSTLNGDEENTRSGLFFEAIRIIKEMREDDKRNQGANVDIRFIRPRYAVYENVPGAFSSNNGEDFRIVLEETAKVKDKNAVIPGLAKGQKWTTSGCIMGDGWSIAWRVHDAQFWGVPQRRKRISLVADFGGQSAPEILFERKSVSGDIESSEQKGEETAGDIREGINGTGRTFDVRISTEGTKNWRAHAYKTNISRCLDTNGNDSDSNHGGIAVIGFNRGNGSGVPAMEDKQPTLQAAAGESGNNQPLVTYRKQSHPQNAEQGQGWEETEINDTLNAFDSGETRTPTIVLENRPQDSRVKIKDDNIIQTLDARMGMGGGNVPMVMENCNWDGEQTSPTLTSNNAGGSQRMPDKDNFNCVLSYGIDRAAFNQGVNAQYNIQIEEEKIATCVAKGPGAVCARDYKGIGGQDDNKIVPQVVGSLCARDYKGYVVRRLTPLECERLQGFPDGWTDIGDWVDSKGKTHKGEADAPRYKALGNSIALPFWEWMINRMAEYLPEGATMGSLFDGIGGFPLCSLRAGITPIWASEIEEFCIAVTKKRFG